MGRKRSPDKSTSRRKKETEDLLEQLKGMVANFGRRHNKCHRASSSHHRDHSRRRHTGHGERRRGSNRRSRFRSPSRSSTNRSKRSSSLSRYSRRSNRKRSRDSHRSKRSHSREMTYSSRQSPQETEGGRDERQKQTRKDDEEPSSVVKPTYNGCRQAIREAFILRQTPPESIEILIASLTDATIQQYNCGLKRWWHFCANFGIDPFKGTPMEVLSFLTREYKNNASYICIPLIVC